MDKVRDANQTHKEQVRLDWVYWNDRLNTPTIIIKITITIIIRETQKNIR